MKKTLIIIALATICMVACTKEEEPEANNSDPITTEHNYLCGTVWDHHDTVDQAGIYITACVTAEFYTDSTGKITEEYYSNGNNSDFSYNLKYVFENGEGYMDCTYMGETSRYTLHLIDSTHLHSYIVQGQDTAYSLVYNRKS